MRRWNTVAIIGVGLIGGSIGLALRSRGLADQIVGIGRRPGRLARARRLGAVTTTSTRIARGVAEAELVVVCTPVERIVEHVQEAAGACPDGAVLTDVGSTKERIVAELEEDWDGHRRRGVAFVGSHPMAGSEQSGVAFATPDLFVKRTVVITPSRKTRLEDFSRVRQLWQSLGASIVRCSPRSHDRAVAMISHLPHVVASALSASVSQTDLDLAATGWRDTTRIAAGDVDLWKQILTQNREHVLAALDEFQEVLGNFHKALEQNDDARLVKLLALGKKHRDALGN